MSEWNQYKQYSTAMIALLFILWGLTSLFRTRLGISQAWMEVYGIIMLVCAVGATIAYMVDWTKLDGLAEAQFEKELFLSNQDEMRPLSGSVSTQIITGVIFAVIIVAAIGSAGLAFYSVPSGTSSTLSVTAGELSVAGPATYFLTAIIPGFFEELLGLLLISFGSLLLTAVVSTFIQDAWEKPAVFWGTRASLSLVWGIAFASAHAQYVGNADMNFWAIFFGFAAQMANQLTGAFISWIPHIAHNSAVVWYQSLAILPLSVLFAFLIIPTQKKLHTWAKGWFVR